MDDSAVCLACGERSVIFDPISGLVACEACGFVNEEGPTLVSGHAAEFAEGAAWRSSNTSGAPHGHLHSYDPTQWAEKKKRLAMLQVHQITALLRLPPDRVDDVKHLLGRYFEGGWGIGRWVEILVGACAYIVIRQSHSPLTLLEVAEVVNCPPAELGRMFNRVLDTLQITLPEAKPSVFIERAVMSLSAFETVPKVLKRDMIKQGLMLFEYAEQWSITTGRHFLPVIAAIIMTLGEVNQLKVTAVQIARELHASQACLSLRSKELKHALIGFAQKLPWGKDISLKTLPRHMPFLLQYLEVSRNLKVTSKKVDTAERKASGLHSSGMVQDEDGGNKAQKTEACDTPRNQAAWTGLPPSFISSREARQRRCKKVASAKARIHATKRMLSSDYQAKTAQSTQTKALDDEDLLVEYLILRGANEDGIKDGYYRTLLSTACSDNDASLSPSDEEGPL